MPCHFLGRALSGGAVRLGERGNGKWGTYGKWHKALMRLLSCNVKAARKCALGVPIPRSTARPVPSVPNAGPGTARRRGFSYSIPDGPVSISISIPLLSFAFLNLASPPPSSYPLHFLPSSILTLPGPRAFPSRADLCRQLTTTTTTATTLSPSSRCPLHPLWRPCYRARPPWSSLALRCCSPPPSCSSARPPVV